MAFFAPGRQAAVVGGGKRGFAVDRQIAIQPEIIGLADIADRDQLQRDVITGRLRNEMIVQCDQLVVGIF